MTPVSERGRIFKTFMFMLAAVCGDIAGWIVPGLTVATYQEEHVQVPERQGQNEEGKFVETARACKNCCTGVPVYGCIAVFHCYSH